MLLRGKYTNLYMVESGLRVVLAILASLLARTLSNSNHVSLVVFFVS